MPIGVSMMALGGLLWRYHVVNRSIEKGVIGPDRGLVIVVTAMVTMMCGAMIVYMLLTGQHA